MFFKVLKLNAKLMSMSVPQNNAKTNRTEMTQKCLHFYHNHKNTYFINMLIGKGPARAAFINWNLTGSLFFFIKSQLKKKHLQVI